MLYLFSLLCIDECEIALLTTHSQICSMHDTMSSMYMYGETARYEICIRNTLSKDYLDFIFHNRCGFDTHAFLKS